MAAVCFDILVPMTMNYWITEKCQYSGQISTVIDLSICCCRGSNPGARIIDNYV